MSEQIKVGIVGLGSMGLGMAGTLAAKGFAVVGYDLAPERRTAVAAVGATTVEQVAEVFDTSHFVVFSLPNAKDVAGVVEANVEVLAKRAGGRMIVIDTSTSETDVSRALAGRLDALGHGFLDAPVSGGPNGAASGTLTMMIGGAEAALAGTTDFDLPFQELALRYCWGEVWDRPGLDRRTRSIVNLSMLSAMGKPNELKIDVRGALTNGVTREEIKEIFLRTCIYAGVPSAGEAFKIAREVFAEPDFAGLG